MKKLICMLLALVTALSLCACGKDTPTDDNENPTKSSSTQKTEPTKKPEPTEATAPTEPAVPSEEEQDMLYNYISTVRDLYIAAKETLTATESGVSFDTVQHRYSKLLEFKGVEKWANTQWAEKAYKDAGEPQSFDPKTDWDPQAVLAKFTAVKDVILRYEWITADHLGNITDTRDLCEWHYGANGKAKFITDEPKYTVLELVEDSTSESFREGLREYDEAGRLSKITEYRYDNIYSINTFTYDADGKLIKQDHKKNTSGWVIDDFTYDAEGRLIKASWAPNYNSLSDEIYELVYTYNADGTLAKEEKSVYDPKRNGEKVIEDYFCVEYTYNNGKLVSSNYTEKEYHITTSMFEGVTDSWLSSVYTSTRTYTLDEKDRVIQEIEIPGDTVYYTYQGAVQQTTQPSVASYTYKTYYGDYYVYTPAEK